jgi:uncharacterized protein (DUF1697 family)
LKLTETIETQLLKTFSVELKIALFTADELRETVEKAPKNFGLEPEKFRYDVWFLLPTITADEIMANVRLREGVDYLWGGKNVVYSSRLICEAGKSHLSEISQKTFYKHTTIRNWNTTTKLLELANKCIFAH